jgi:hypothetical protein
VSNWSAVVVALAYDQADLAKHLIALGCQVNNTYYTGYYNVRLTALQVVVLYTKDLNVVQVLLEDGADVNKPTRCGPASRRFNITALGLVFSEGPFADCLRVTESWNHLGTREDAFADTQLILLLLNYGANVYSRSGGDTILQPCYPSFISL